MKSYHDTLIALREDDPSFLHLELHGYTVPGNFDPYDLIQAVKRNKTIKSVQIWKEFLLDVNMEQGRHLFEAIGDLPKCEELFIDFPDPRDGFPLQLHALTCVLTGISPLKTLSLRNVVLTRHEVELAEALQSHQYLREVQIKNLLLTDRSINLDPLLHALSCIPTLRIVEIRLKRRQSGACSIEALQALCRSKSLVVLKLWQVKLTEELVVFMSEALEKNKALRALTLFDCNLSYNAYIAIAHMLKQNTGLKELQLYDEGVDDSCCKAIANGLERNETLQALTLQPLVPLYPYNNTK